LAASKVSEVFKKVGIECLWGGRTPGGLTKTTSAQILLYGDLG